jgi:hypothetical protein
MKFISYTGNKLIDFVRGRNDDVTLAINVHRVRFVLSAQSIVFGAMDMLRPAAEVGA